MKILPDSDWMELVIKCTLTPLVFFLLAQLLRLGALDDMRSLLTGHKMVQSG